MTTRALIVGISEYHNPENNLPGVNVDVTAFTSVMASFNIFDLEIIRNGAATSSNVCGALLRMLRSSSQGDTVIFYFSGHGFLMPPGMGSQGETGDRDQAMVPYEGTLSSLITDNWMRDLFRIAMPPNVFFWGVYDCCYSGDMYKSVALDRHGIKKELTISDLIIDGVPKSLRTQQIGAAGFAKAVEIDFVNAVHMGAAEEHRTALVLPIEGVNRSVFTWALQNAARPGMRVIDFARRATDLQASITDHHKPQIFTSAEWATRPLFT